MAKRSGAQILQIPTELTVSKADFKRVLTELLSEGQRLYEMQTQTNQDLEDLLTGYRAWTNYVSEYLKYSFNKPENEYRKTFNDEGYSFMGRIGDYPNEVSDKKDLIHRRISNLTNLIKAVDFFRQSAHEQHLPEGPIRNVVATEKNQVFIVHGHDEAAKVKAARFIEKLELTPIILHEQPNAGKTVIEKIEEHTNVGFGIILYTPCDVGGKKGSDAILMDRARQNVVFEHGYLIGKIGRKNVCALVKGNIETPTDISGVLYITMDDGDAWQIAVARELKSAGYTIDMNRLFN
jgi:predicted nucleotide-binding protein